jgi:YD repeat-containing protein
MLINIPGTPAVVDAGMLTQVLAYDDQNRVQYIGLSQPGRATSTAGWQIRELTYDADDNLTTVAFAGGSNEFAFIWDNRAGYTYS